MIFAQETMTGEIIVDNFAGGGGASTGIDGIFTMIKSQIILPWLILATASCMLVRYLVFVELPKFCDFHFCSHARIHDISRRIRRLGKKSDR